MRKYENVDVPATLGAVMEVNTEHYRSDFRYDMEMFKKAARQPDGENNHLLWLSRRSGTECVTERNAYISNTHANHAWSYYAGQTDRVQAFAVTIKCMEGGHIVGDIYELDYMSHVREIQKDAQPAVAISLKFADGAEMKMPYKDYDRQRDSLIYEHGKIVSLCHEPQDESAVRLAISAARKERESEARPAAFKVRVQN